jgi:t-SNARE complex subunit (syntaxin)
MSTHYDRAEPLAKILDEFTASVNELVQFLEPLSGEAWSRESRHETLGGGFTTQVWVERGLAHIEEHLASVRKARRTI